MKPGGPRFWRQLVRALRRTGAVYKYVGAGPQNKSLSRWLRRHQIMVQVGGLPGDPCAAEVARQVLTTLEMKHG